MTRKKVTLAYINNAMERKASLKKRKKGLIKKVTELATLCDVEACAIIYSPYEPEPEVWPSPLEAMAVITHFRNLPELDRSKKMVNHEIFTYQRVKKVEDKLRRIEKEEKREEMESFLFQSIAGVVALEHFDMRNATEYDWVINQNIREVISRMEAMKLNGQAPSTSGMALAPPPSPPPPTGAGGSGLGWELPAVLPYPYTFNNSLNEPGNGRGEVN